MTSPLITESKVVLKKRLPLLDIIVFTAQDDIGVTYRTVAISLEDWILFGKPEEITVTITPGDILNEESHA